MKLQLLSLLLCPYNYGRFEVVFDALKMHYLKVKVSDWARSAWTHVEEAWLEQCQGRSSYMEGLGTTYVCVGAALPEEGKVGAYMCTCCV